MAEQQKTPSPSSDRLWPVVIAAIYIATVIASFGFISLFADRDVIDLADAGPLLGPAMVAGAGLVTFTALRRSTRSPTPWGVLALGAVGSYATMLAIGGVGYALVRGQLLWVVFFVTRQGTSPFLLTAAGLSGLAVVALWAVSRSGALR